MGVKKMNKKEVVLSDSEIKDCAIFQKKIIEAFSEFSYKYKEDKQFEIFAVGIGVAISNIMASFGVKNLDLFLNDLINVIKTIHNDVQKNAMYMQYKDGKKISEGRFN